MVTFGSYLKKRREALGWSVEELALKVGVDPGYISQIEDKDECPDYTVAKKIFDLVGHKAILELLRTVRSIGGESLSIYNTERDVVESIVEDWLIYKHERYTDKHFMGLIDDIAPRDKNREEIFRVCQSYLREHQQAWKAFCGSGDPAKLDSKAGKDYCVKKDAVISKIIDTIYGGKSNPGKEQFGE